MRQCLVSLLFFFLHSIAVSASADDRYWGGSIGYFDADFDDGNLAHINSPTASVFLGWDINRYLGVELQIENIDRAAEKDDDGFETVFSGTGFSPALIFRYPLGENIEPFIRLGATYMDYEVATPILGGNVEDAGFQSNVGIGFRFKYLTIEYVNYGDREELFLEQTRIGLKFSF